MSSFLFDQHVLTVVLQPARPIFASIALFIEEGCILFISHLIFVDVEAVVRHVHHLASFWPNSTLGRPEFWKRRGLLPLTFQFIQLFLQIPGFIFLSLQALACRLFCGQPLLQTLQHI